MLFCDVVLQVALLFKDLENPFRLALETLELALRRWNPVRIALAREQMPLHIARTGVSASTELALVFGFSMMFVPVLLHAARPSVGPVAIGARETDALCDALTHAIGLARSASHK